MTFSGPGCSRQLRKERDLASGNDDMAAGRYAEAEVDYRKALKLVPADPVAIRQLSFVYFDEGLTLKALVFLRKSAELEPGNAQVQVDLGLALATANRPKEAAAAAKQALKLQPGNADALQVLAESVRTTQDIADTRTFIAQLRKGDQDRPGYPLAVGVLDVAQGDFAGGEREFKRAIALDPKLVAPHLELGNLAWLKHDQSSAGAEFQAAADLAPLRSQTRLRYIDFKLDTGAVTDAKKLLDDLIRQAPDYIPAAVYRMNLAQKEARYADCAAAIKEILARDPTNYDALLAQANLKLSQGNLSGAVADYQRLEGIYPDGPMIKFQLALAYMRQGNDPEAEKNLNQAVRTAPDFELAVLLLAQLNIEKGNATDAVASLTLFISKHLQVPKAYVLLGRAFENQHKLDQALLVYRRMGVLFPKDPQAPYLGGTVLARQKRFPEARQAFEQSAALAPTYVPAIEMLVNADLLDRRFQQATARTDQLAEKFPKSPVPWLLRAKIMTVQQNRPEAIQALLKAIDLDPKAENPYLLLADVYLADKKPQLALAQLKLLVDRTQSEKGLMETGIIQTDLQQYAAARNSYETLLAANPTYTAALNNLAYLESEHLEQIEDAYEVAKRAHNLTPDNPSTTDTLGWILFRRADYPSALVLLKEAAAKLPKDPAINYHLGRVYIMLGDEASARQALQQALAIKADFAERGDARQQLAFLDLDPAKADTGARAALEARVHAEPNNPLALTRLAQVQQRNGDVSAAAANLETAAKLSPRDPLIRITLAQLYLGPLNDPVKARSWAKAAHELAPDDPQISRTLGNLLYQVGDYPWALNLLVEASRLLPNQPDLIYDLARAYYSAGNVPDAESTLQDLLQSHATFSHRAEAQRLATAIANSQCPALTPAMVAEARAQLDAEPNYIPALALTALAAMQRADYTGAAQIDEAILARDPYFAPATLQLAMLYAEKLSDDRKAFDFAIKARASFPDEPELPKIFGILEYRRAHDSDAVHWLQDSLRSRADDPETIYYLGMAHYRQKDPAAAGELQRALNLHLSGTEAAEAQTTLGALRKVSADSTRSPASP